MKTKKQPNRKRPVVAVTLSPGSLTKLDQLTKLYGKSYDSHTVEKIIEDTPAREFSSLQLGSYVPGQAAAAIGPESINPSLNDRTVPVKYPKLTRK